MYLLHSGVRPLIVLDSDNIESRRSAEDMAKRYETSDGRYVAVASGEWWDTTGTEIVPEEVVDRYCAAERVGVVVLEVDEDLGELPDDGASGRLN